MRSFAVQVLVWQSSVRLEHAYNLSSFPFTSLYLCMLQRRRSGTPCAPDGIFLAPQVNVVWPIRLSYGILHTEPGVVNSHAEKLLSSYDTLVNFMGRSPKGGTRVSN